MNARYVYEITGMTCDHCAVTIKKALERLPGVSAEVSFATRKAVVDAPESLDSDRMTGAIREAGYSVVGEESDVSAVIIGSGSAAFAAAIQLAASGRRITMVERGTLGGTCVNIGCVPSKIFIRQAELMHHATHGPFPGIAIRDVVPDFARLRHQQNARVEEVRTSKYAHILEIHPGIRFLKGTASFVNNRTLKVVEDNGVEQHITADRVLIATGARPAVPDIPGLKDVPFWTSTEALAAQNLPEHLLVLGGGFVACELGQAFRRMGSRVTLFERGPALLSGVDPDLGKGLEKVFVEEGIGMKTHIRIASVRYEERRFILSTDQGIFTGDALLVATGRAPNTEGLNLAAAGVETDARGYIRVDGHLRTNVSHIYAAGDCTTLPPFVYVAAAAGTRAASNMLGEEKFLDVSVLPEVIFTDPAVAVVGLSEMAARTQGLSVESRVMGLELLPRALANFDTRGFIKLVAETGTGRLVGAHILASQAGEMIQTAHLAILHRMTVQDLGDRLFPYLTMVEGLKLAAQSFTKEVANLSCCAG
jgi:mercuric reductase